jgi:hypothetical protein
MAVDTAKLLAEYRRLSELLELWRYDKITDITVVYRQQERCQRIERGEE